MAIDQTDATRSSYGEVIANGQFRVVFTASTLAIAADTLRIVALSILVYSLTGSAFLSALAFGIIFLPQVVGSTFFGALADRFPARRLIVSGYAMEAVTGLVIGFAHLPIGVMLAMVAVNAAIIAAFAGSRARILVRILDGDAYVLARSMLSLGGSAAQLVGLGAAGAMVGLLGPRHALLVSAAGHVISALSCWLWLSRDPDPEPTRDQQRSVVRESLAGNKLLLGIPSVRRSMLSQWLPPTFIAGSESLIVAFALRHGYGTQAPGILLAGYPVGMILGDLVVGRCLTPQWRERLVPLLVAFMGIPLLVFAFHPSFVVAAVAIVVSGAGCASALGQQRHFVEAVPPAYRGQAFGLLGTGMMTVQGLGAILAGAASAVLDVGVTMAAFGALTGIGVATWLWASQGRE